MRVIVTQPFAWYHRGFDRQEYPAGVDPVELPDDVAAVALAERWARPADEAKAEERAPENKDAAPRRARRAAA